ncbi:hypothetical protein BCR44DRAFT_47694 [Catenaria anguillulae PL171]|uniref:Uncharacterized protein n=1 Tax=Catenaria anguillulae PL171 TaxID=765915 RepID=A0A1Y2HKU2_9FUNG|nr:hypothetical protein BCR44DRAFT_47694 [Catenaria anguillulae PL171]
MESTHTAHSLDHIAVIDIQYSRTVLAYSPATHHDARKLGNTGVTLAMASLPDSFSAGPTAPPGPSQEDPTIIRTRRQVIAHLPLALANGHKLALVLTLNAPFTLRRSTHGGSRTHPATVEYRDISLPSVVGLVRALAARLSLLVDPSLVPHRDPPRDGEDKVTVVPHVQDMVEHFLVPCIPKSIEIDSFAVLGDSPAVPTFALADDVDDPSESATTAVLKNALVFHTASPFGLALSNHSSFTLKSQPHAMWMLAMFARLQTIADSCTIRTNTTSITDAVATAGASRSRSRSRSPTNASISHHSSHSSSSPSPPASTSSNHGDSAPNATRVNSSSRSMHSINSSTSGIISGHSTGPPSMGLFAWFGNLGRRASAALSHQTALPAAGDSAASSTGDRAQSPHPHSSPTAVALSVPTHFTLHLPALPESVANSSTFAATWVPSHSSAALFLQPADCQPPSPDPVAVPAHLDLLFPTTSTRSTAITPGSAPDSPASSRTGYSTATLAMHTAPPGTLISPFTSGTHLPHLSLPPSTSSPTAASTPAAPAGPIIDRIVSVVDSACDASDCQVTVGYALATAGGGAGATGPGGAGRVTASGGAGGGVVRRVWVAKESALGRGVVVVPGHFEQSQQGAGGRARDKESAVSGAKRDNVSLAAVVDVLLQQG